MKPAKVFVSYSHKDEAWKNRIITHLKVIAPQEEMIIWDDRRIDAGSDWLADIQEVIHECDVALLLISADFLTSKFILQEEVPKLLERRAKAGLRIIPVILRPCAWTSLTWLKQIQARPRDGKPLSSLADNLAEEALALLTEEVVRLTAGIGPHGGKKPRIEEPLASEVTEEELQQYSDYLSEEIRNDLVRELVKKPFYEDFCVTPMVASLDSRGENAIVHRIESLAHEHHSIIIGEPGSGKTTALRLLALRLLRHVPRASFPVLVSLAAFKPGQSTSGANSFEEFLDLEIHRLGCGSLCRMRNTKSIEPILLLDGWDEAQAGGARETIKSFLRERTCRYIITSRPEETRSLPAADRYEMRPLEGEKIHDFIRMRFRKERLADELYSRIRGDRALGRLARNPLTLSIMTIVYADEGHVRNMTKTMLYEVAFNAIMREYHRHRSQLADEIGGFSSESKLEKLLRSLAFSKLERGGGRFFTAEELMRIASSVYDHVPRELPSMLAGKLAIIRDRSLGRYEFYHLWYQEFLAAKEIVSTPDLFDCFPQNAHLSSALPYVVGLLRSTTAAFDLLTHWPIRDPFTYCRALAEGGFSESQNRDLIHYLLNWAENTTPTIPVREELAKAIGESGTAMIASLYCILWDEGRSDYFRRAALEGLTLLDDDVNRLNEGLVRLLATKCTGLLWHVVEQVGVRRLVQSEERLRELSLDENPITAGDSLWALSSIHGNGRPKLSPELVQSLLGLLWADDSHVRGHALRTIGRLQIAEALPALNDYLANTQNDYRWIVVQAAALIDGSGTLPLFRSAIRDRDKRVTAEALIAIRDVEVEIPSDIHELVIQRLEDNEWVRNKDCTIADIASVTAQKLAQKSRVLPLAQIYLARHSKTQWNLEGKLQGKTNLPLCELGRQEAQLTAKKLSPLKIDRIVTSTADRARQTGKIYSDEIRVPLETAPLLRELDHGHWEGRLFAELSGDSSSGFAEWLADPTSAEDIPGSVESAVAAQNRIVQAICEIASTYKGQTVLVIAHKHINALFMCHLLNRPIRDFSSLIEEGIQPCLLPAKALAELCQNH